MMLYISIKMLFIKKGLTKILFSINVKKRHWSNFTLCPKRVNLDTLIGVYCPFYGAVFNFSGGAVHFSTEKGFDPSTLKGVNVNNRKSSKKHFGTFKGVVFDSRWGVLSCYP